MVSQRSGSKAVGELWSPLDNRIASSFHLSPQYCRKRFPHRNPPIKEIWIKATGISNWVPEKHDVMCSEHFEPSSFVHHAIKTCMQITAVPTLKLPTIDENNINLPPVRGRKKKYTPNKAPVGENVFPYLTPVIFIQNIDSTDTTVKHINNDDSAAIEPASAVCINHENASDIAPEVSTMKQNSPDIEPATREIEEAAPRTEITNETPSNDEFLKQLNCAQNILEPPLRGIHSPIKMRKLLIKQIRKRNRKLTNNIDHKEDKPAHLTKAALELDKFKRRLIRAVARLLISEKKPEEEIWKELKKETCCDCELLWARMRALTVKKLNRLFLANDCMDAVPAPARMSLTDWLMFDLVLVHQKIDLIGQADPKETKEDAPVLVELFRVVKLFNIENLSGNQLAEAWSLATLYYNNQGHQCSPMLLQRRWYLLREATRFKFYDFWYAYRGNTTRINHAEPFRPTPLQTEIAKTFKSLITQPFYEWEEMIKRRLVTMPDEFEVKMKERAARRRPPVRKPSVDVPDLVMIEPRIETIDLRLETDDNATERDKEEEEGIPAPPLVRIKQEPLEDMEVDETPPEPPKKSIFEVVLESTDLENLQIDSMDAEEYDHENNEEIEENIIRDEEEPVMPQIGTVFGNVTDTSVLANIDDDPVFANIENIGDSGNVDGTSIVNADDTNVCNDISTGIHKIITLEDAGQNVCGNDKDACEPDNSVGRSKDNDICDDMRENRARNNDQVVEVSSDDKDDVCIEDIQSTVRDPNTDAGEIPDEMNEISDEDDYISDSSNFLGRIDETSIVGNVIETNLSDNVDKAGVVDTLDATNVFGSIGVNNAIVSVNAPNIIASVDVTNSVGSEDETSKPDNNENGRINDQTKNSTDTITVDVIEDVEIIENPSQPVVVIDSDEEILDDLIKINDLRKTNEEVVPLAKTTIDQPMEVDITPEILEVSKTKPSKVSEDNVVMEVEIDVKPDVKDFKFGELPPGIVFADDGIEFVDKGMAYFDEDISNEDIKYKEEDEEDDTPKIDLKLLMCPVVYTIRLDDMDLFHTQPFDHIKDKHLLDAVTKKNKPLIKETIENVDNSEEKNESVKDDKITIEYVPKLNNIDNNSLIVKEEPLDVNSETIAPQDQGTITSSDNDSDSDLSNSIDETLKVKPTSFLLQKPRSRRYNPIQLCKNPDFNTRLKRLSVGFFSSPRNRVLIKSCKPLTIDVSKTFESKLISGTLYLKPADHNVTTKVIDDTESHSVSVVPSAMPAQSLIDNSKVADILPMLRQCLEASKQPVDVPPTSERNKVINLPDITEIRRINQRLLTAEVTPIQIQNNQPQVPVSIISSPIIPMYTPQKTITTAEIVQDSRATESTDITGPTKLLEIIDDSPAKTSTEDTASIGIRTDFRFINGFRPRQPVITGRPPKMINGRRVIPPKPVAWKPRSFRPQVPWLTRNNDTTLNSRKFDETLLTLDALNKMLFLLTDKKDPVVVPPKNPKTKVKRKNVGQQTNPQRGRPKLIRGNPPNIIADEEEPSTSEKPRTKCQKPKINIKSASNYPPDKEKSLDSELEEPKKKIQYCCWARQRMLQLLFRRESIPHHGCSRLCQCCCRNLLTDYILQENKIKSHELEIIKGTTENNPALTIVEEGTPVADTRTFLYNSYTTTAVGDVKNSMEKSCQTIPEIPAHAPDVVTVQDSGVETVVIPDETTVIDLEASNTKVNTNENDLIEQAVNQQNDVPSLGFEVSVTTTATVPPLAMSSIDTPIKAKRKFMTVPTLKNSNFISGVTAEAGTQAYQYTCISSDSQSGGIILNATPNTTITSIPPPSLTKLVSVKKSKAHKTKMSMEPFVKPFEPPKHIREKMIFINSKQISEKPTASPLHLGKNKILLTTIKFPPNLKLFHEAKVALKSSLNLPTGVHIILLADGTVSYKIDPNVEVNATDMKEVPAKIKAVRTHMDTNAAQEQALIKLNVPLTPTVTEGEVVDLVDDDDDSAPNVNGNDNETPLVANVQTTEENVTINIDGSPNVSHNSQMDTSNKIEGTDFRISTNETATESNQNENIDQNSTINNEDNIRESTQNEMRSASTEQLQSQHDPSNKVSTDVYHPCTSAEKSEDLPDPSSQHQSPEINLAKTSNQIESSEVREVLEKQAQAHSETSGQTTTIEVEDLPEPAKKAVRTEIPEENSSESSKPKSKNILSDLMEMSGIFDEDMTPENEVIEVPAPEVVKPPAIPLICQGTTISRPILIPTAFNQNPIAPKIQSAIGELSAITSLYELKYACANKGIFFKLDMENGYLVPINVCMKGAIKQIRPPMVPSLRSIAPKPVIDLTEDDDNPKQQCTDKSPETSPGKRSLLLVNNSSADDSAPGPVSKLPDSAAVPKPKPSGFTGPARPVKLFKALKPNILQRLNLNKINQRSMNLNSTALNHKTKRKQFLRSINLNAGSSAVLNSEKLNNPVLMRPFLENFRSKRSLRHTYKGKGKAENEPIATSSHTDSNKKYATTVLSDDSSDDEPLAKIAKKRNENINAPKLGTREIESNLPVSDSDKELIRQKAPVAEQIELELPVPDIEYETTNEDNNIDQEAPVDKQNDPAVPANAVQNDYLSGDDSDSQTNELPSDGDNDSIDPETPFGFDVNESNEEDEDRCILGV